METILASFETADVLALGAFAIIWLVFEVVTDHTSLRHRSLSWLMAHKRREWMLSLADRDIRVADTTILNGQIQGTVFFGTACILAIGGCFAAFGASDVALQISNDLLADDPVTRVVYEVKIMGLLLIFIYSFFKFGWAFRLFSYCSILMGAVPSTDAELADRRKEALLAAKVNTLAGKHFTAGLRGIFMALAYLGWFVSPLGLVGMTLAVICVLIRRQFYSKAKQLLSDQ